MKHLLYLLLAASLLTEQPLYGAPKKNKKIKKKGKKIVKKGSAKTSASGVSTSTPTISTPTAPTPAQTIKTEATMTKQKAQKLMEAYLEKYRKDVLLPMTDIMSKIQLISQGEKLQALVKQRSDEFLNNNDIDKKINTLMTIFDDKNAINIQTSNNLKNEFKKIAEELKKDLPEKIKANKTEEQKVIKELESQISDKFEKVLNKSKSDGKSLNEEIVKIKKEKEAIEKNYPQIIQTILNIHSAVLSLIENDILKGFFGEISKEESAKKSSEKKKAYYDAKDKKYTKAKEERKEEQKKDREDKIKILKEKIKKETDKDKKEKLERELRMMSSSKEMPSAFKYTQTSSKNNTSDMEEKSSEQNKDKKEKWTKIQEEMNQKLEDYYITAIKKLAETRSKLDSKEKIQQYIKTILLKTTLISEDTFVPNKASQDLLIKLIGKAIETEKNNNSLQASQYIDILEKIITEIKKLDFDFTNKNPEEIKTIKANNNNTQKKIYSNIINEINQTNHKEFFEQIN